MSSSQAMAMPMPMAMPTATTEEFSFPTTTDLHPYGIDSPPLWRLSPAASPDVFLDRKGKDQEDCFLDKPDEEHREIRKSFSYEENGSKAKLPNKIVAEDEEEKMDMLWEDFNEELPRSRSSRSSEDMVEFGCGQALKLSKSNGAMFSRSPRRAGMQLVFMRVLRKLFLLHSSHGSVKHRTWQTP